MAYSHFGLLKRSWKTGASKLLAPVFPIYVFTTGVGFGGWSMSGPMA
jgi:hypothetical protein